MIVLTPQQMQTVDQTTIARGFPELLLMEAAGRKTAEIIQETAVKNNTGTQVIVFCGKGNNGGDGLVIARFLDMWGFTVQVVLAGTADDFSQVSYKNYQLCQLREIKIHEFSALSAEKVAELLQMSDIVVDALLGTGISGEVRGSAARLIGLINDQCQQNSLTVAVDIPSGISGNSGQVLGQAVTADLTAVMAFLKTGLTLYPGRSHAGEVEIVDIGIPPAVIDDLKKEQNWNHYYSIDRETAFQMLPARPQTGHKGTFGKVAVIGGSRGMTGAPFLSGRAALTTGAGLVKIMVPREVQSTVAAYSPEVMTAGLSGEEGCLNGAALSELAAEQSEFDVIAVGPGMGRGQGVKDFINGLLSKEFFSSPKIPLLLDADALNEIGSLSLLREAENPLFLTPHPGEMARLLGKEITDIEENRLQYTREFARENKLFLVLKGAATTIGLPSGDVYINRSGNQGLATAGSGDVLTGIIAGLLAQGLPPKTAVILGPYLHGMAGDLALFELTASGLTACGIIDFIPAVFSELKNVMS